MEHEERLPGSDDTAVDMTSISSPISAHSSGYSSADDENLLSPKHSAFCHFNPDDELGQVMLPGDSGLSALSPRLPLDGSHLSGQASALDEFIDVDSIFDPLQSLLSSPACAPPPAPWPEQLKTGAVAATSSSPPRGMLYTGSFDTDCDMMDVESTESTVTSAKPASNITINLPPGFNPSGQDGKSVLLDVLRKADKSQLLKIHEQINAAMASISNSNKNGKASSAPELQISITPSVIGDGQSTGLHRSPGDVSKSPSVALDIHTSSKRTASSPATAAVDFAKNASLPGGGGGGMDTYQTDAVASLLNDIEPCFGAVDILNDATNLSFADTLLNDVNLGAPASAAHESHENSVIHMSESQASGSSNFAPAYTQAFNPISANASVSSLGNQSPVSDDSGLGGYQACGGSDSHAIDMAAAVRGLDDHSYTSKSLARSQHVKFAAGIKETRHKNAPVLEHLLTTKRRVNPMKGSDHVARGLQQLALNDAEAMHGLNQPNLLKQLLTGQMDKKAGSGQQLFHNGSILTRRGSAMPTATVTASAVSATLHRHKSAPSETYVEPLASNTILDSLDILGSESTAQADCLWNAQKDISNWNTGVKTENDEVCIKFTREFLLFQFSFIFTISHL